MTTYDKTRINMYTSRTSKRNKNKDRYFLFGVNKYNGIYMVLC